MKPGKYEEFHLHPLDSVCGCPKSQNVGGFEQIDAIGDRSLPA